MRRRTDRQKNAWMKERTTQDEREMSARQRVIWSPLPRSLEILQHASGASAKSFAVSVCVLVHECVSLLLAGVCALAMRWRVLQLPSQMCLDKKSRVCEETFSGVGAGARSQSACVRAGRLGGKGKTRIP